MPPYRGKRVTIMGLGSFGGGVGAARFFAQHQAHVTVTDLRPAEQLRRSLDELAGVPVAAYHFGGHCDEDFAAADLVVVNPAVPPESPLLELARRHAVPLTAEMNLFFEHCPAPIIGVTGSNGKSTTTALIHALLKSAWQTPPERRAWLGGNIGRSLLPQVEQIAPSDLVVLELSSFQLEALAATRRSPHVAVVTNFTPNHLDRHHTLEAYRDAKQNILRFQTAKNLAVLNFDDPDVASWASASVARVVGFGLSCRPGATNPDELHAILDALPLPGRHNRLNALAAATAVHALTGAELDMLRAGLARFRALPHRLELVAEIGGRRFYNDSIATTPESTIAALEAFDKPVLLIAGGYDKGIDLAPVARAAAHRAKAVALIGQTADALAAAMTRRCAAPAPPVFQAGSLETALQWAWKRSAPGDVILLSPACASYDQFQNFAHRGETFRRAVARLAEEPHEN